MTLDHEFAEATHRGYGNPAKMALWAECPQEVRKEILYYLLGYRSVCEYLARERRITDPAEHVFRWSGYTEVNVIGAPLAWLVFFALGESGFSLATLEREAPIHLGPRDAVSSGKGFVPPRFINNGFFIS